MLDHWTRLSTILAVAVAATSSPLTAHRLAAHPPSVVNEFQERLIGEEITAFRKRVADAVKSRDRARLTRLYSPRFQHTDAAGKISGRDEHVATVIAGGASIETAPAEDLVIRAPNDWVAIATGRARLEGGAGEHREVRWTAVYTRAGESWHIAASHVTRLEPGPR